MNMRKSVSIKKILTDQAGFAIHYWLELLAGFLFILMGLVSFFKGSIDYKNVSAPITKPTSIIIMAAGGFMMRIGYKGVTKNVAKEVKYLKCPGCGHVCFAHEAPDSKCPKCSEPIENLDGFFDRHAEFRDKKTEKK